MLMPWAIASSSTPRSSPESMPLVGATPKIRKSGGLPRSRTAAARSVTTGMPFGPSPRSSPESPPACELSMTDRIS